MKTVITSPQCTPRTIMRLQGLANWVGGTNRIVRLMVSTTRLILKLVRGKNPDVPVRIPQDLKIRLCSWLPISPIPQRLGRPDPDLVIQTDASLVGWGFKINKYSFAGQFSKKMNYSINTLELLTIWLALLVVDQENLIIQVLNDNSTAIQTLKKGGSPNYHLRSLVDLVWKRVTRLNWTISFSHIKGAYNIWADQLSRNSALLTEWSLQKKDFQKILWINAKLQVDLFATSLNNQLKVFISPCPDQKASAVDALTTSWDKWEHLYLFPPTPLISKVLAKLAQTKFKTAVLVTPELTGRPWYMALRLHKIPSIPMMATLQQIVVNQTVQQEKPTKLRVWKLLGKRTRKGFLTATEQ